ncbi:MAG: hypothetical protein FWF76_02760, partial [Oscillospiraceae bacterium]|nr:hypothetical protein [Oscillospiraceae bacterium]
MNYNIVFTAKPVFGKATDNTTLVLLIKSILQVVLSSCFATDNTTLVLLIKSILQIVLSSCFAT